MQSTSTARPPVLAMGRFDLHQSDHGAGHAALALRSLCFRGGASDEDDLDPLCQHVTVTDRASGQAVAAFRLSVLQGAAALSQSYAARFYDLGALHALCGPALELGRFCLHPDWHDPDILRLSWAALTRQVKTHGIALLCGCSSFAGSDPALHMDALAHLARTHLAPHDRAPRCKVAAIDYPALTAAHRVDPRAALARMPPLLRTYLGMGGWVSDHAVIDHDLNTLHVFTGVEIARIPPARARILRSLAEAVTESPA